MKSDRLSRKGKHARSPLYSMSWYHTQGILESETGSSTRPQTKSRLFKEALKTEEHRRYSTQGSYQSTTIGDNSFDYNRSHISSAVHLSRIQAKKQKALLDRKTNQDLSECYKPLGTLGSVIKNLTLYEKMEVVNPNYVHEREAGEEIILNRAADNFFTVSIIT